MKIYILMFEDKIERASCNNHKIYELTDEYNGFDENGYASMGPYYAITIELEDTPEYLK